MLFPLFYINDFFIKIDEIFAISIVHAYFFFFFFWLLFEYTTKRERFYYARNTNVCKCGLHCQRERKIYLRGIQGYVNREKFQCSVIFKLLKAKVSELVNEFISAVIFPAPLRPGCMYICTI